MSPIRRNNAHSRSYYHGDRFAMTTPSPHHHDIDIDAVVAERLTEHGHRYTSGRRRLIQALADAKRPVTLPEIVASNPELAPSSAYRNLDVLEQCDIIRRVTSSGDHTYFELAEQLIGHHHHLICVLCGAMEDVHLDEALEDLVDETLTYAATRAGYKPLHHTLDVYGHCPTCLRNMPI